MSEKKDATKLDTRENRILEEIVAANAGFTIESVEKQQSRSSWVLVAALVASLLLAVTIIATHEPTAEESAAPMQEKEVAEAPASIEEPVLTSVPPPATPSEVATETTRVAVIVRPAEVVEPELEPDIVEAPVEPVVDTVVVPEVVDQTKIEMRPVDVPEGVNYNQFAGMEQTVQQPRSQPQQTTTVQPSIEQSTVVAAPTAATSTYSSGFLQAPIPSFSGIASDYLRVETQFLSKSNGLVRAMSMFIVPAALFDLYDDHTASGEARYTVDVGQSSMHGETITLGLYIPRVADVRNVTSDKSGVDKTWLRSQLISAACQDVGNIRTVMEQTRNELAAEANGYELTLNWYTQKGGKYVPRDVSDEELISYCQLG